VREDRASKHSLTRLTHAQISQVRPKFA